MYMVYLPIHLPYLTIKNNQSNVGKYTVRPTDGMGYPWAPWHHLYRGVWCQRLGEILRPSRRDHLDLGFLGAARWGFSTPTWHGRVQMDGWRFVLVF